MQLQLTLQLHFGCASWLAVISMMTGLCDLKHMSICIMPVHIRHHHAILEYSKHVS